MEALFQNPLLFVIGIVAFIVAISVHEASHALAGKLQGDPTAELEGRLTLDPRSHIDPIGTIAVPIILLLVSGGAFAFGWARPTPFNPYNLKYKRFGPALVALAGPLSNFLVTAAAALILGIVVRASDLGFDNMMVVFFISLIQINLILGIFNLIPIPPLDGAKVLYSFIGERFPQVIQFLERYGTWLLLAFIIFDPGFLTAFYNYFLQLTFRLVF